VHLVGVLDEEFESDPRDDDEGAVDERRVLADELDEAARDDAHRDNAEDAAGHDDPGLSRHRDRDEDRVDREREVDDLDAHDRRPERRQPEPGFGLGRLAGVVGVTAILEVNNREIEEVGAARELHPGDADEVRREKGGERAEGEAADESVTQRLLVVGPRQAQHHDGHDQRVVGAEQALEDDEQPDGREILEFEGHVVEALSVLH
jgi:hypothetical protein